MKGEDERKIELPSRGNMVNWKEIQKVNLIRVHLANGNNLIDTMSAN